MDLDHVRYLKLIDKKDSRRRHALESEMLRVLRYRQGCRRVLQPHLKIKVPCFTFMGVFALSTIKPAADVQYVSLKCKR